MEEPSVSAREGTVAGWAADAYRIRRLLMASDCPSLQNR